MKNLLRRNKWLILALLVSLFVGKSLLTTQHFHTHDDIQIFRVNEYLQCWADGQIPCRWSKNLAKGFGYPLFIFYPPMIYAVPALLTQLDLSIVASLNLFAYLMFPLAAYAMYKLMFALTKNTKLAFLASVAYTMYPYHAVSVFVRGVYAETFAWSIFPLILEGFYVNIAHRRVSYKPALALSLVVLAHNISTMIIYPLTLIWSAIVHLQNRHHGKRKETIKTTLLNLALPIGISAFFLIPAVWEKRLVQTESMIFGYYAYLNHFVSLKQLFVSNFWGYGGSSFGAEGDGMSFMVGKPYWIAYAVAGAVIAWQWVRRKGGKRDAILLFTALAAGLFIFLTHAKSTPIWQALSPLQYLQFPWRLIGLAGTFMIITIFLAAAQTIKKTASWLVLVVAALLIVRYGPYFRPEAFDAYTDFEYLQGELYRNQQQEHLYDYMPKTVNNVPDEFADKPIFKPENTNVETTEVIWQSNKLSLIARAPQEQTVILALYAYPGWELAVDGAPQQIKPDATYGMVELTIPQGEHRVLLRLTETPIRKIATIVSLLSVALLGYLLANKRKKTRYMLQ